MVTGGIGEEGYLDSTELLIDGPFGNNNQWVIIDAKLPTYMSGLRATTINNQVLTFGKGKSLPKLIFFVYTCYIYTGGSDPDSDGYIKIIYEFNITSKTFNEIGNMLEGRTDHAISVVEYSDYAQFCSTSGCLGLGANFTVFLMLIFFSSILK